MFLMQSTTCRHFVMKYTGGVSCQQIGSNIALPDISNVAKVATAIAFESIVCFLNM